MRLARERNCDAIHALGRAAAWSAYLAARLRGMPFITSWYKGFREQNVFKRLYNGVMARGDRVVAVSEQIAQLVHDRYGTPWERIAVVPVQHRLRRASIRQRSRASASRRCAHAWGVKRDTKVILVTGRILRRKGHHVVVRAVQRLKDMGLKDFLCVFVGEDRGHTHYTGELWDLVLATGTMDVIRMAAPVADMPAAYAAACGRGVGGGAAGRPAARDPGGAGDGAAGRSSPISPPARKWCSPRRRCRKAASPACAFPPATTPRWRPPCCGCSPCRN